MECSVLHNDGGPPADNGPEFDVFHGEHGQRHGDAQQRKDRDDAGEQGNTEILHGHGGQVGNDEREHQFGRLQLAYLTLAHQADPGDDEQIEDNGT